MPQSEPQGLPTNAIMSLLSRFFVGVAMPVFDSAVKSSALPFRQERIIDPNLTSNRYGWTHFGVFFPKLPAPFNYCNVMTLFGSTGAMAFDNDYLIQTHPRDTATFLSSTATGDTHHYRAYSIKQECTPISEKTLIQMSENLKIDGTYPDYHVYVAYDDFVLDMTIHCTDVVSWFIKNMVYDHFSLLAVCQGYISKRGQRTDIPSTLCTFEYARCMSAYTMTKKVLPEHWKAPLDFFTYQIINLNETTQILLTQARVLGESIAKTVQIRTIEGNVVYEKDVVFDVLTYQEQLATAPDGKTMRLPQEIRWTVKENGVDVLDITGTIDSAWRFGHGRGYVSCYKFSGHVQNQHYDGQGYIEYANCR